MLSRTTKYGLKTVMHLAAHADEMNMLRTKVLAGSLNIPKDFLSQILYSLTKQKLISSKKGPGGGFYLTKQQLESTPFDIIHALEGDDFLKICLYDTKPCDHETPCVFHRVYSEYKLNFIADMSSKSLSEFIGKEVI